MYTTLNKIRDKGPYVPDWAKLLKNLNKTKADDEPLSIISIIDSNGIFDATWCLRAVEGHDKEIRLFAVDCARDVQHLMTDPSSIAALDASERFAHGELSIKKLSVARDAALASNRYANKDAWAAGMAAVRAADRDAGVAVMAVAWDAAWASEIASSGTAWYTARAAQEKRLRWVCESIKKKEKL